MKLEKENYSVRETAQLLGEPTINIHHYCNTDQLDCTKVLDYQTAPKLVTRESIKAFVRKRADKT